MLQEWKHILSDTLRKLFAERKEGTENVQVIIALKIFNPQIQIDPLAPAIVEVVLQIELAGLQWDRFMGC